MYVSSDYLWSLSEVPWLGETDLYYFHVNLKRNETFTKMCKILKNCEGTTPYAPFFRSRSYIVSFFS